MMLTSIEIPASVTSIGDGAFYMCVNLSDITIPDKVISIGKHAFGECHEVENITIGNKVASIGDYAFAGCISLSDVTIPNNVTSIGEGVFTGCGNLSNIIVDTNNQDYTSVNGILFNKKKTLLIQYPAKKVDKAAYVTPDGVNTIGNYAFSGCRMELVVISDGVTSIGDYAFVNCGRLQDRKNKRRKAGKGWNPC